MCLSCWCGGGGVEGIQVKVGECVGLALEAVGGVDKPLGRELGRLVGEVVSAKTLEQLDDLIMALKDYLKDIQ
jgi:hypothetical protein